MSEIAYQSYWERKRLLRGPIPRFPLRRWWPTDGLCDIERVYFAAAAGAANLLDVGAGDLRIMRKFKAAGLAGDYDTQDVGTEYDYTFKSLDTVTGTYDAVLCLDVIEHLPLEAGLRLLAQMISLLSPGGVLIVQTPNARCVRNPLSWDMTHVQLYNLTDLWATMRTMGLTVEGYRVVFQTKARRPVWGFVGRLVAKYVATRILGGDYADNIAVVARKSTS